MPRSLQGVFLVLLLQVILIVVTFKVANCFRSRFSPAEVIAIVFCATHKSLTLGMCVSSE